MSQTIVVTGANRGLGLEFTRQLSLRGERVVAACRNPGAAGELRKLDVSVEELDTADAASVAAFVRRLGGEAVDVLVNNAGQGVGQRGIDGIDWDEVERLFTVNAVGPMRLAQALLPHLRRGERKLVANITSRMGSIEDNTSGGAYAYRASKAALNMMNKSLAIDLLPERFTCVVLHPGWVATRMGGDTAPVSPADSVAGMLHLIDGFTPADTGTFVDYTGEPIPW